MGFEFVDRDMVWRPVELRLENKSLASIVRSLVATTGVDLKVDFSAGLIDVYKPEIRSDSRNVLNTVITRFQLKDVGPERRDMSRFILALLLLAVPGVALGSAAQFPSRPPNPAFDRKLDTKVSFFSTQGQSFVKNFLKLVCMYKLPAALEYVDEDAMQRPLSLTVRSAPLRDVIRALVARLPEYRVTFVEGIVDVYSPQARRNRHNLLNTIIPSFSLNRESLNGASTELANFLRAQTTPGEGLIGDVMESPDEPIITLDLRNKPVREILCAIVAANGSAVWAAAVPPERLSDPKAQLWAVYPLGYSFCDFLFTRLHKMFMVAQ